MLRQRLETYCIITSIFVLLLVPLSGFSLTPIFSNVVRSSNLDSLKPSSNFIKANGIRIHYLEWNPRGDSTIILLHGLYDTSETWSGLAPLLAANHRIIALDRRGAGLTDKPAKGYDFQTLAKDVLSVIRKLKLKNTHVVGHSAGGGVALTAASMEPKKIDSVILVDGGFWPKRGKAPEAEVPPPCEAEPADCRRLSAINRGSMDYDPEPLYPNVLAPTLLIFGLPTLTAEAKFFVRDLKEVQANVKKVVDEKLRNSKIVVIEDTSHWIQHDQPSKLAAIIKELLARV